MQGQTLYRKDIHRDKEITNYFLKILINNLRVPRDSIFPRYSCYVRPAGTPEGTKELSGDQGSGMQGQTASYCQSSSL